MDNLFADISNNNLQPVDWQKYHAAGHALIGLKATEGITFVDEFHARRSEYAHQAGIWVIHYHFAHPADDYDAQAEFFWGQIKDHYAPLDFACLDIEITQGLSMQEVAVWTNHFVASFQRISAHTLVGYSDQGFARALYTAEARIPGNRWWLAAYGPQKPFIPGLTTWAWQFTDGQQGPEPHACDGIGPCDISSLNQATYERLRATRPS